MSENLFTLTIHLIHGDPMKFEVEITEAKKLGLSDDIEFGLTDGWSPQNCYLFPADSVIFTL